MTEYSTTLHVDVPPEQVFALTVDPEFQQSRFMKIEAADEAPPGVGSTLRYHYEVLGRHLASGTCTYAEFEPGRRFKWDFAGGGPETLLVGGPVSSTWIFEPAEGGTDVTVRPEFTTRIPVVNHVARRIMMWSWRKRTLPKFVAAVEKRAGIDAEG